MSEEHSDDTVQKIGFKKYESNIYKKNTNYFKRATMPVFSFFINKNKWFKYKLSDHFKSWI